MKNLEKRKEIEEKRRYEIKIFGDAKEEYSLKDINGLTGLINNIPEDVIKRVIAKDSKVIIEIKKKGAIEELSEEEIKKIKEAFPEYDSSKSWGGASKCVIDGVEIFKIILRAHPNEKYKKEKVPIERLEEITLHEIGHFVYDAVIQENDNLKKEWQEIRVGNIFKWTNYYYKNLGEGERKKSEKSLSEDFCETFQSFLRIPKELKEKFPARYAFCKKLINSLSKPEESL